MKSVTAEYISMSVQSLESMGKRVLRQTDAGRNGTTITKYTCEGVHIAKVTKPKLDSLATHYEANVRKINNLIEGA